MRYAGLIENDIVDSDDGICVSLWMQGCPHHCKGCHNPETWDFNGGKELTEDIINDLIKSIKANDVNRNLCIMGGEPLCEQNLPVTEYVITRVKEVYPEIKVYVWTGYTMEELDQKVDDELLKYVLYDINCIIDGRFIFEKRDITLPMRGSSNQRIIYLKEGEQCEY